MPFWQIIVVGQILTAREIAHGATKMPGQHMRQAHFIHIAEQPMDRHGRHDERVRSTR